MADLSISDFAALVAKHEGNKKQVNIANIKEVLRVVNDLTGGDFYKLIKKCESKKEKKQKA